MPADEFVQWILSLDRPGSEERPMITMAQIIERARASLSDPQEARRNGFREELESLIGGMQMHAASNTPEFILARYLSDCLEAFDRAVRARGEFR